MRTLTLLSTLLITALLSPAQTPTGDVARGKTLFDQKIMCYTCHGRDGMGGQGARLVPMKLSQGAFTAYVRNPRQMNPYSEKVLSNQELADMWAYLKSLPEAREAKSIPLLNQILNQK